MNKEIKGSAFNDLDTEFNFKADVEGGNYIFDDHDFNSYRRYEDFESFENSEYIIDTTGGKIDPEVVVFNHDFQKENLVEALSMVRKFIVMNKRILTGGMAIDLALKNKGSKLYSETKIPDYDFYSPTFHVDAYKLGEQLSEKFTGVSVIRGLHVSTMRVRINFVVVADITYIPIDIYDTIPTIEYQGFTLVHPHYQMIDQHRALSLPYENPPRETILGRWKKDIERYDLLVEHYPIDVDIPNIAEWDTFYMPIDKWKDQCIGGYASFLYWGYTAISNGYKSKIKFNEHFGEYTVDKKVISIKLPNSILMQFISDDYKKTLELLEKKDVQYYNAILDKIPRRVETQNTMIIDNKGRKIAAYKTSEHYISNLQESMCTMLTLAMFSNDIIKKIYLAAYKEAQQILFWAASEYTKDKILYSKYLPSADAYGDFNWSESYIVMLEDILVILKDADRTLITPRPAYPEKNKAINRTLYDFQPGQSELYQFDGKQTKEFEARKSPI